MSLHTLTPRQRQVADLVKEALTNKEIGQQLGISEQVVKNYLREVFDKLGLYNRLELCVYMVEHEVIENEVDRRVEAYFAEPVEELCFAYGD